MHTGLPKRRGVPRMILIFFYKGLGILDARAQSWGQVSEGGMNHDARRARLLPAHGNCHVHGEFRHTHCIAMERSSGHLRSSPFIKAFLYTVVEAKAMKKQFFMACDIAAAPPKPDL